jgi:hemin uptake protein HemP
MREIILNCAAKRSAPSSVAAPSGNKPRIESNHLFQGTSEIVIVHRNEEYSLRITRNDKLILTK